MTRFLTTLAITSSLLFFSTLTTAQESPAVTDLKAMDDQQAFSLTTMTCNDIFNLFDDAAPGEGKEPAEVVDAQDDVLSLVVWVHGYLSGRDGLDGKGPALNKKGIEETIANVGKVCEPNPDKRFLDVVSSIK